MLPVRLFELTQRYCSALRLPSCDGTCMDMGEKFHGGDEDGEKLGGYGYWASRH